MGDWGKIATRAKAALTYLVLVVLGGLAVFLWTRFAHKPTPVYTSKPSEVKVVEVPKWKTKIKTELVPVEAKIEFLRKEDVEKKMEGEVPDNVVAVGQVPPHKGKTTVVSSLIEKEGALRGVMTYRQEKMPFFEFSKTYGARIGYGTEGFLGEAFVRPLRVGPAQLEGRIYGRTGNAGEDPHLGAAIMLEVQF